MISLPSVYNQANFYPFLSWKLLIIWSFMLNFTLKFTGVEVLYANMFT